MECQECQKRVSSLHFTQVVHGKVTEVHVCEICAKEKGYMTYPGEGYSLHNLLTGLFNFDSSQFGGKNGVEYKQTKELQCLKCNMTFTEFKRAGKFGCATCYRTFSPRLDPILRRVHSGNIKHHGKIPKRKGGSLHKKKQLETYTEELQHLIESEAFEEAAVIRDKIKDLKEEQVVDKEDGDNS